MIVPVNVFYFNWNQFEVFCAQNRYAFCVHLTLHMCVQFLSCKAINYQTRDHHGYYIKNLHKMYATIS
jgi:hypothetical protein